MTRDRQKIILGSLYLGFMLLIGILLFVFADQIPYNGLDKFQYTIAVKIIAVAQIAIHTYLTIAFIQMWKP